MRLDVYLNYRGNCEEAFRFYEEHLGGRITGIVRHDDIGNPNVPEDWGAKITHARIEIGGTVLMGGLKVLNEGRNEFGPPFLSKIPYINRLFKNVGIGRDTRHVMIMVTPRIIINAEEEIFQTEGRPPFAQP